MKATNPTLTIAMVLLLVGAPLLAGKAGRWAGKGAAGGAVLGLLVGGDLGSAAEGAALGAAAGAAGGAISNSNQKKKAQKAELEELRRREAERQAEQQAHQLAPDLPQTEEEWLAAIGQDNVNALDALVECQYDRARLLAQAGATSEKPDFALVGHWLEALVAVDQRDPEAEQKLAELIELDDDIDSAQQAGLVADQAILEVRRVRENESLTCAR